MREFTEPAAYTVPEDTNLTDPVWQVAVDAPDHVLYRIADRDAAGQVTAWRDVTARRFADEVTRVAKGLLATGVQSGDRVGLMSRSRYEWTLLDYAIWAAGAVTVPLYESSSAEQIRWVLGDSGAVAVVVETPEHQRLVEAVRGDLPDLRSVWQVEAGAVEGLRAAGADLPDAAVEARRSAVRASDTATIIYTSGTTGRPKGCVLTHRNMLYDVGNALPRLDEMLHEGAATLLFLPLAHGFARLLQVAGVQARITLAHSADVKNLMADLASFRPTFILSVPRVFEKVYNTAKQKAHAEGKGAIFDLADRTAVAYSQALDHGGPGLPLRIRHAVFDRLVYRRLRDALGGACRYAISGGAPLGVRLSHFFRGVGLTVIEGYGLTETSPAASFNTIDAPRLGTVGRPLPGTTIRIADDGEVLIAGDHVFEGYWHDPEATAAVLADGFFHSGDLGELDADGYLTITGRKKELIVTAGGKNVAPAVLEDRVRAHALVSQAMVVGDGRPFIGCLVTIDPEAFDPWKARHGKPETASVADLVDDPDLRREIQAAVDEANTAVSRAEAIKVFRILPRDFTEENGALTPSLKLKRAVVQKEYADEIAAIYTQTPARTGRG